MAVRVGSVSVCACNGCSPRMPFTFQNFPCSKPFKRVRLLYVVLAVLLLVGLLPLALAGTLLSRRSADELRAIEGPLSGSVGAGQGQAD